MKMKERDFEVVFLSVSYTLVKLCNVIHDSFEPFEGPLFSCNPIKVGSVWVSFVRLDKGVD